MVEPENPEAYKQKLELFQAMAQVDTKEKEIKSSQGYIKAYLLSLLIPPIGIYYFVKYVFFSDGEKESIKAGIISLIITMISLFLSIWLTIVFFKQSTSSIPPENLQMLKDLAAPENQKKLLELYK